MKLLNQILRKEGKTPENLLDTPLYEVPGTDKMITWADCIEGTLITGATGSGKSSGPGRHAAKAMLQMGFGMCILCAKPDERKRWVRYIQNYAPKRKKDLVIFNRDSDLKFNFLKYEMDRIGEGSGDVLNAVDAIMNLNEQNRIHQSGGGGGNDERFWDNALRRLISRTISTLRLAGEEVSIWNMRKLVSGSFREDEAAEFGKLLEGSLDKSIDPVRRKDVKSKLENWVQSNYFLQIFLTISNLDLPPNRQEFADIMVGYWTTEFPKIGERATNIIVESFMGNVEPFLNEGILMEQFSGGLSPELLPENIYEQRKIVIIDFPLKEFGLSGVYAATIYKTAFQAAMERRDIESEINPVPVGLWIDEYQSFCSPKTDSLFQATARSSWVATVYITQSINNLYFVMGNSQPQARTKSLLGNLNLKFFGSNADYDTNHWASQMIGEHITDMQHLNIGHDMQVSKSKHQQMSFKVRPDTFTSLKTGRRANGFKVEAIVFKAGKSWGIDNQNFAKVQFDQR